MDGPRVVLNMRDYLKTSTALPAKKCFIDHALLYLDESQNSSTWNFASGLGHISNSHPDI